MWPATAPVRRDFSLLDTWASFFGAFRNQCRNLSITCASITAETLRVRRPGVVFHPPPSSLDRRPRLRRSGAVPRARVPPSRVPTAGRAVARVRVPVRGRRHARGYAGGVDAARRRRRPRQEGQRTHGRHTHGVEHRSRLSRVRAADRGGARKGGKRPARGRGLERHGDRAPRLHRAPRSGDSAGAPRERRAGNPRRVVPHRARDSPAAELLLDHGADSNGRDERTGNTPLEWCVSTLGGTADREDTTGPAMLSLLLARKADPKAPCGAPGMYQPPVLVAALEAGAAWAIRKLIDGGACGEHRHDVSEWPLRGSGGLPAMAFERRFQLAVVSLQDPRPMPVRSVCPRLPRAILVRSLLSPSLVSSVRVVRSRRHRPSYDGGGFLEHRFLCDALVMHSRCRPRRVAGVPDAPRSRCRWPTSLVASCRSSPACRRVSFPVRRTRLTPPRSLP